LQAVKPFEIASAKVMLFGLLIPLQSGFVWYFVPPLLDTQTVDASFITSVLGAAVVDPAEVVAGGNVVDAEAVDAVVVDARVV